MLSIFSINHAQDYDLIVTTKGDSIACHIDSITKTQIYFEMMINYNWVHTLLDKSNITEFKQKSLFRNQLKFKKGTSFIDFIKDIAPVEHKNYFTSKYWFSPSAFTLNEGESYYGTHYGLLHDFQHGVSDRFSLGVGGMFFGDPMYLLTTYSFPINDNSAFAVGDFLLADFFIEGFFGNILYGLYSRGNSESSFTIGTGIWASNNSGWTYNAISPAFTFSFETKITNSGYFVMENYGFQLNYKALAEAKSESSSISEYFSQKQLLLTGLAGFRVISKKQPLRSWQFGLCYIFIKAGEVPDKYETLNYYQEHLEEGRFYAVPIPTISFSRRFLSKK